MLENEETVIPLRPFLTNTTLNLQLEFVFVTREKEQIKKLMRLAHDFPEKIRGEVIIKDKVLLAAKIKELENEKKV